MEALVEPPVDRKDYIGGSDAAAVLGLSRYRTPLDVWAEKTGAIARPDRSKELHIKLGHRLEQVVSELFCEETGLEVRRVRETQVHPKYPFLRAQIDRRIIKSSEILECKTTSGFNAKEWEDDDVPSEYVLQCLHQLMVTGKERCHIACLIGGNQDFVTKVIERDDELIAELERKEIAFWENFIVPKVMPAVSASDAGTLLALFPQAETEDPITLPSDVEAMAQRIKEIGSDKTGAIGALLEEQDKLKNEIRALVGEASIAVVGKYKITWKNQSTGVRLDTDRIKLEAPEVYEKFGKAGSTRVLRITEAK